MNQSPKVEVDGENVTITTNMATLRVLNEAIGSADTFDYIKKAGVSSGESYFGTLRGRIRFQVREYNRERADHKIVNVRMTQAQARELGLSYSVVE